MPRGSGLKIKTERDSLARGGGGGGGGGGGAGERERREKKGGGESGPPHVGHGGGTRGLVGGGKPSCQKTA